MKWKPQTGIPPLTRRQVLQGLAWTPIALAAAPLWALPFGEPGTTAMPFHPTRFTPHYPEASPLERVLKLAEPGTDEFTSERYAAQIDGVLREWSKAMTELLASPAALRASLASDVQAATFAVRAESPVRTGFGLQVLRRQFVAETAPGADRFVSNLRQYLRSFTRLQTAELQIVALRRTAETPLQVSAEVRYEFVGSTGAGVSDGRESRTGSWQTQWSLGADGGWRLRQLEAQQEVVSRTRGPVFTEVTPQALGGTTSYREQMLHGVDHWRSVLDGACGIDVYGNNGLAVGDPFRDGRDSIYVCQPSGLPNRLYRNRGDGTFEDATELAGVGVLDATACALFADFENKGLQDLLVVTAAGPLLFVNQGNGKFQKKRDVFRFAHPPQGAFTHAAAADYDRDGRLDLYFCLYSYYVGLDQYHYPAPYFDARNGPPNLLLHNEGDGTFRDRTEEAGLNVENNRYSFACAWGDLNGDGWPDLYVANDFGRSNLYRNNGKGTFTECSTAAHAEDVGAGMSATWVDIDNDGRPDVYVSNMWSAAGSRVSEQAEFHPGEPAEIMANYRRHARGNSLYRNWGDGTFRNVAAENGAELARWAWSSDAWDFDHDGFADLYCANGYITGSDGRELSSFFWRQVVGKSPQNATPAQGYEQGWNAINEMIRSDASWAGPERNVFFANDRKGNFADVAGVLGMDFPDDSRTFALADLDGDGRLEMVLKNRNAPQLRILRNAMPGIGRSVAVRLRGTKSNRDAIGAAVTVECGSLRQTRYLQAGTGFLSQHSKELHFGLGDASGPLRVSVRWPNGGTQTFEDLPAGHRMELTEGESKARSVPFAASPKAWANAAPLPVLTEPPDAPVETWLLQPLAAPEISLPDLQGATHTLSGLRGKPVLVVFWSATEAQMARQLRALREEARALAVAGVTMLAPHIAGEVTHETLRTAGGAESSPVLQATPEIAGIYNIVFRYLFDRRRDLVLPASFLVDGSGMIRKVYQGPVDPARVRADAKSAADEKADATARALPFPGTVHQGLFQRNDFTYGVAFFQHGYLQQAVASFQQVIAAKPEDPAAHYNLGTLYLRLNQLGEAERYLNQAVALRPDYPEAWNNLGMAAAQQGRPQQAVEHFQRSLQLRPDYATALLNLGNLYRRQRAFAEAEPLLLRALAAQRNDPEPHYSLGMLYAQQEQTVKALPYLLEAIALRPDYADAMNNLGVLYFHDSRFEDAERTFRQCIATVPAFDQAYVNLARLYVQLEQKQKALDVLNELLRLQPENKLAKHALELLR